MAARCIALASHQCRVAAKLGRARSSTQATVAVTASCSGGFAGFQALDGPSIRWTAHPLVGRASRASWTPFPKRRKTPPASMPQIQKLFFFLRPPLTRPAGEAVKRKAALSLIDRHAKRGVRWSKATQGAGAQAAPMCDEGALRHAAACVTALGRGGEWPKARGGDGRLSAVARLRAKVGKRGAPPATGAAPQGGRREQKAALCDDGAKAEEPLHRKAWPRRGAPTCDESSRNERITTTSVQGGALAEPAKNERLSKGTDRPPWVDADDVTSGFVRNEQCRMARRVQRRGWGGRYNERSETDREAEHMAVDGPQGACDRRPPAAMCAAQRGETGASLLRRCSARLGGGMGGSNPRDNAELLARGLPGARVIVAAKTRLYYSTSYSISISAWNGSFKVCSTSSSAGDRGTHCSSLVLR